MSWKEDWDPIERKPARMIGAAGMGALRISLLFGSGAIALALFLTPVLDRHSRVQTAAHSPGIDFLTTGSLNTAQNAGYVIRRSVLQASPEAVCVIQQDGSMRGDC